MILNFLLALACILKINRRQFAGVLMIILVVGNISLCTVLNANFMNVPPLFFLLFFLMCNHLDDELNYKIFWERKCIVILWER